MMTTFESELRRRFALQTEYLGCNKEVNKINPLVSVSVPTYNQDAYIQQCLDGILCQKTSFPIEVIVGEDGSFDKTGEICESYADRHQDKIRLFFRDRKDSHYTYPDGHVQRYNGIWCRMSARGKYVAICEGDDYWTDPLKLQKQVDFMEMHPEVPFCCHRFQILEQEHDRIRREYAHKYYGKGDLLIDMSLFSKVWVTQPLTALIRKDALERAVCEMEEKGYPEHRDVYLFYSLLKQGNGVSLNQNMGVYRLHKAGISATDRRKKFAKSYEMYKAIFSKNPGDVHIRRKLVRQIVGILVFDKKLSPYKYDYLKEGLSLASRFTDKMGLWCALFVPKWMKR